MAADLARLSANADGDLQRVKDEEMAKLMSRWNEEHGGLKADAEEVSGGLREVSAVPHQLS